ncbi:MAG TPA: uracil-DNA glycosylase [Casimicrobiaceae bacterium]|nr:uracil-DNA glycosylase [Casimicrobiaceae bacterium]
MTRTKRRGAAAFPIAIYDPECRRCARLAHHLDQVHAKHPTYHCRPVAPFGAMGASLVIVGLAPGMHGANATGRPFTGDYAGKLLYATLHKFGFASRPLSVSANDGLRLIDARITNAVKCLPPVNKPLPSEIRNCNAYLAAELATLPDGAAVLALGRVAHEAALRALGVPAARHKFTHGAVHMLDRGVRLFDSYHCSRQNTNTKRLTPAMFEGVFAAIARHRSDASSRSTARAATATL